MNFIQKAVVELLGSLHKVSLPFDYMDVVDQLEHIQITSFSEFLASINGGNVRFEEVFNTRDACVWHNAKNEKYIIIYNDHDRLLMSSRRYIFSIAHELGHIFLGHLKHGNIHELTDLEYQKVEADADRFAGYLLFPFAVLKRHGVKSKADVQAFFKCSGQASEVAFSCLNKWLANRGWGSVKHIDQKGLDEFDKELLRIYSRSMYQQLPEDGKMEYWAHFKNVKDVRVLTALKKMLGVGY